MMTMYRLCVYLIVLGGLAAPADAAIVHVSRAVGGIADATATDTASTNAQAHTAGNTLIALVSWNTFRDFTSLSNTAGDMWVQVGSQTTGSSNDMRIYCVASTAGHGTDVVTLVVDATTQYFGLVVHEFSGVSGCTPDGTAAANDIGTAIDSGSVTVTAAQAVIVAYMLGSPAITAGSGYTLTNFAFTGTDATKYWADEWKVVTASEAATATASSGAWMIIAASLPATAGGGAACRGALSLLGVGGC